MKLKEALKVKKSVTGKTILVDGVKRELSSVAIINGREDPDFDLTKQDGRPYLVVGYVEEDEKLVVYNHFTQEWDKHSESDDDRRQG